MATGLHERFSSNYLSHFGLEWAYEIIQITMINSTLNGKKWLEKHNWRIVEPPNESIKVNTELEIAIQKKNAYRVKYDKQFDECWLVIVFDKLKRDEQYDLSIIDTEKEWNTKYEKIFVFDQIGMIVYELKTVESN